MSAPPYRNPPPPEPEPPPPPPDVGALRSIHTTPPLHRALLGPVAIAAVAVPAFYLLTDTPLVLSAALGAAVLAVRAYSPIRFRGVTVELHAGGLVLCKAGARRVVPFSEVNEVWFELELTYNQAGARLHALRLLDFGGAVHLVPLAFEGAAAFAGAVLRETSEPLLVEARQAMREGVTLTFGRVQLDRDGIVAGKTRLDWRSMRLVVFQRGKVFFYRRWPILSSLTVRLDRIPNPTVLGGLVASYAPRVRVDDRIVVPLATEAEAARAVAAGGSALALRTMLIGGLSLLAGLAVTCITYARHGETYVVAYGPILFGAYQFLRGLAAYRSGPRR
jgi:hypothetical protein